MKCPKCNGKTQVMDVVHTDTNQVYRRRKCLECGTKFYSAEAQVVEDNKFKIDWWNNHRMNKYS